VLWTVAGNELEKATPSDPEIRGRRALPFFRKGVVGKILGKQARACSG